jgi:hypothetical protein
MSKPLRVVTEAELGDFNFALLDQIDWEGAFRILGKGKEIDVKIQQQIQFATAWYLWNIEATAKAVPLKKLLRNVKRLNNAAEKVRAILSKEAAPTVPFSPKGKSPEALGRKIFTKIEKRYFSSQKHEFVIYEDVVYPLLLHATEAVIVVSSWVEIECSDPKFPGRLIDPWWTWIQMLTGIMRSNGLSHKVSKGMLKSQEEGSRFTRFVLTLQGGFPKEFRRHHTPDSAAQAIVRIRGGDHDSQFDVAAFMQSFGFQENG